MNTDRIAKFLTKATEAFERGFTTKSAQKQALEFLGVAYDELTDGIKGFHLSMDVRTEKGEELYWAIPYSLSGWRSKHSTMSVEVFPQSADLVRQIEELVELRQAIKDAEIIKVERKVDPRIETIRKSLFQIHEQRKAQYVEGVRIFEVFGNLDVTVTSHYVVNQFGTGFIRHWYYLNGTRTALQVIIAVMDAAARIEENRKNGVAA